jgi:hypothetical protein
VHQSQPDLVTQATDNSPSLKRSKNQLKKLLLEELKTVELPDPEAFKHLHVLSRRIDRAFQRLGPAERATAISPDDQTWTNVAGR